MNRNPEILFIAEYIKNVLYFATVRQGKVLKNTADTHYFCIDNELVYENYYADFGPLNLGCVYKYCKMLNEKINQYINKQMIVHYTSIDPKKKANAAFLIGCYGVLYLSLTPRDALKPLVAHGQNYKPFQDATQGDSPFTISLLDCLQAIKKARQLGFFNFRDFDCDEYERLDKIHGGDLNWIVPGKFLAFIGPEDHSVSIFHPPTMYIDYFLENNVRIVIRLNKRMYDGNVFNNAGIIHYDLFFPDGTCPPRHILFKFLEISEEAECSIAVHCKAGLGRTGSLIGCYLIKHYKMTAHEAIGWMRICRPGSVIANQQAWLEKLEQLLIKQGNYYRKQNYKHPDKLPCHKYGIYSIAEQTKQCRSPVLTKSPSPPPPLQNLTAWRSEEANTRRPQNSRIKEAQLVIEDIEDKEIFLTACDLTATPSGPMKQIKGCILKSPISEEHRERNLYHEEKHSSFWRKYLCCQPCVKQIYDGIFMLAVRCTNVAPEKCKSNAFCCLLNMVATHKAAEKERDLYMKKKILCDKHKTSHIQEQYSIHSTNLQQSCGAGDPKPVRPDSGASARSSTSTRALHRYAPDTKTRGGNIPITTFRTSQAPVIKSVNDAKNFLMRSSIYRTEREKHKLSHSITVTPQVPQPQMMECLYSTPANTNVKLLVSKGSSQPSQRRRLGRSPSPPVRMANEQSRASNTPSPTEKFLAKDASKHALKDILAKLRSNTGRDGSLGAASLGAEREAPTARRGGGRAPSVRSDERPLATQGDLLNSIKIQRRLRESLNADKTGFSGFHEKISLMPIKKQSVMAASSKTSDFTKSSSVHQSPVPQSNKDRPKTTTRSFVSPQRPLSPSPRGRRPSPCVSETKKTLGHRG